MNAVRIPLLVAAVAAYALAQPFHPDIPRAWDDRDVTGFELPLAQPDHSPRYLSAAEYYSLEETPIYRGYPVYIPEKEPPGYIESLKQKEPEIQFDPAQLRTQEDWIRAGAIVFQAPRAFRPPDLGSNLIAEVLRAFHTPATPEGVIPFNQYVVRKKGVVELGVVSCASCHTRVVADGTVVEGGQGNFPWSGRDALQAARDQRPDRDRRLFDFERKMFDAPWVARPDELYATTAAENLRRLRAMQPGVIGREGTSSAFPVHVPSLIGIKDVRYLDATGLTRHRSIEDLMRYAIVNQDFFGGGLQLTAHYGGFQPANIKQQRYSDEQLYALALYLYSLKPPPNPNSFNGEARRGERIFQQQGCGGCHTPPLYTNNKLTPAVGFHVPEQLRKTDQILDISVGTDSTLAMRTRRGTGFYKVPPLRGVWYRNAFGHMGQAETLEEWFDPARLRPDYVPQGFHLAPGPIKGHEFGLKLSAKDRSALIGFLKSL
jgi:hypothetical protein